jgi:CRISPR-associated endonuclease/helicase Cas3
MKDFEPIAHVRKNKDGSWDEPQRLEKHLLGTAEKAALFAAAFDSADWGYAEGIGHDTGKGTEAWQRYLCTKSGYDEDAHLETKAGKQEHSAPGAKLVEEALGKGIGRILSYCIAGHHAGLADWLGSQSALAFRLQNTSSEGIPIEYRERVAQHRPSQPPWKFSTAGLDISLWIRMLFSCLVDADFLDTEAYMSSEKKAERGGYQPLSKLLDFFNAHMAEKTKAALGAADTTVNRARQQVLADCRSAAGLEPGLFSLTVPTGGGKTLSSMAFALEHALKYDKERVIYVIPYTSIIEQNADVFREAVGKDQVVEHHSNLDDDDSTLKARLAAENWDAPVIVTTSVQFFESLFAAKTSRCRKLHNIANSVVVLDEAQLVPVEYLEPILATMKLLCEHYKVSFVMCTATQPAFEEQDDFPSFPGFSKGMVREIVGDVPALYRGLKRVEVEPPADYKTPKSWEELAEDIRGVDRILCVVSDRKSCRDLYALMPKGSYHLSALMCPQHRSDVIAKIKEKLQAEEPVHVVSTQLVEAGVDIDFPVVYRAMAGLDSIAQAAGRCNREGKLNKEGKLGRVVVFVPPRKAPVGILRKASETATRMLEGGLADPIDHSVFAPYFSELYWKANSLDGKGILKLLTPDIEECGIQFRSAAEAFQIIDDKMQRTILVPYGEGEKLIGELKVLGPERWLLRKLQRYSVNIYTNQFVDLRDRGSIEEVSPGIFVLTCSIEYDATVGLLVDEMPKDPAWYIG